MTGLASHGVVCAIRQREEVLALLPVHEADRHAAAEMSARRAAEYLAARTLLRSLLARTAQASAGAVIAHRPAGQPYLSSFGHLGISLSHSGQWVAAAVGIGRAVGIDVEVPSHIGQAMLDKCCAPADATELAALPAAAREHEFARIWTVQEACVKAAGTGLAGQPWRVPVPLYQRRGEWMGLTWVALRDLPVPAACAYGPLPEGG